MARPQIFVFRLLLLVTTVFLAASHQMSDPNSMMDLCFSTSKNETGHIISKWTKSYGASNSSSNRKICMKSNIKKEGWMQVYRLNVEVAVPPPRLTSYELFPGVGYYKFHPVGWPTYYQASSTCIKEGGHLVIIDSQPELEVVKILFTRNPRPKSQNGSYEAFIGFTDIGREGQYVTVFGKPLVLGNYLKWNQGQPNNAEGNQDCGSINSNGQLNDYWCDRYGPLPFICEYDLSWDV